MVRERQRTFHQPKVPGVPHILEPEARQASIELQFGGVDLEVCGRAIARPRTTVSFGILDMPFDDERRATPRE
jgi:hypothetical protein